MTIAILQRHRLDCEALNRLIRSRPDFVTVGSSTSLGSIVLLCEHAIPEIAILDASYPHCQGDVFVECARLLSQNYIRHALFLDDRPNRVAAIRAFTMERAGYVTRQRTDDEFLSAIESLRDGQLPLDGFKPDTLSAGPPVRTALSSPILAPLSPRELEVLQLIGQGHTVNECASALRLKSSTIENHRTSIMKKLGVRTSIRLALVAIREGLVSP